jgi:hypothetical protein
MSFFQIERHARHRRRSDARRPGAEAAEHLPAPAGQGQPADELPDAHDFKRF